VLGLDPLESHPVRAKAEHVANLWVLKLRQDAVDAVHVEAEQVLNPVVGVGAAARRRAHLRKPRPDRGRWRGDRDRTRRDSVCPAQADFLLPKLKRCVPLCPKILWNFRGTWWYQAS